MKSLLLLFVASLAGCAAEASPAPAPGEPSTESTTEGTLPPADVDRMTDPRELPAPDVLRRSYAKPDPRALTVPDTVVR